MKPNRSRARSRSVSFAPDAECTLRCGPTPEDHGASAAGSLGGRAGRRRRPGERPPRRASTPHGRLPPRLDRHVLLSSMCWDVLSAGDEGAHPTAECLHTESAESRGAQESDGRGSAGGEESSRRHGECGDASPAKSRIETETCDRDGHVRRILLREPAACSDDS